jgi:hypothetical protein
MQFEDASQVADQVGTALLDAGQAGVELVPAGVVVADEVPGPAVQDAKFRDARDQRAVVAEAITEGSWLVG